MVGGQCGWEGVPCLRWRPVKYESRLFEVVMKSQMKDFCNTSPNSLVRFSFPFSLVRMVGPDLLLAIAVLLNATQSLAVCTANTRYLFCSVGI